MLYKTNVLLVPLGDDFRWEDQPEWNAQLTNYQAIFDYINSQPELHAEVIALYGLRFRFVKVRIGWQLILIISNLF